MSEDCGKLKNSNCLRHVHKGDFPKFGQICSFFFYRLLVSVCSIRIVVISVYSIRISKN